MRVSHLRRGIHQGTGVRRAPWREAVALLLAMLLALVPLRSASAASEGSSVRADAATRESVAAGLGKLPLYFVENQGQIDARAAYYLQGSTTSAYFTKTGVVYALTSPAGSQETARRHTIRLDFEDANPDVKLVGQDRTEAVVSYFKGRPSQWRTALPTFTGIVYEELWPGIDLVYEGVAGRLKYSFVVKPGADPRRIRLVYRGASEVRVTAAGRLAVETPVGGFEEEAPYAYQGEGNVRTEVQAAFEPAAVTLDGAHRVGFHLGAYDESRTLVLDPVVLLYCGYLGGSGADVGRGIAVDSSGNAYVAGYTASNNFPVSVGPDLGYNLGANDAFVAKVNAAGTALIYAGYIGGSGDDQALAIAVDAAGSAYLTGTTTSTAANFPVTVGPDLSHNGAIDAWVAKVNTAGTALVYCGFLGGTADEVAHGIAVDGAGGAYVVGRTGSSEASFPETVGPGLTYNGGFYDAFVAKVDAAGAALVYCGYLGGSGDDVAHAVALDSSGNAYLTGNTGSSAATFPETVGPDLTYNGGFNDAFVAKVGATGAGLVYCGYIGGAAEDGSLGIAVDAGGAAYVTGNTNSTQAQGFPLVAGPDLTYNGGLFDAWVSKVKPLPNDPTPANNFSYSGYIGGLGDDPATAIAVDSAGSAYVVGRTASSEASFPVTRGPDLTYNGGYDVFVTKLNPAGTALVYSGYIGGLLDDFGTAIAVDGAGKAFVTGSANSSAAQGFPVTNGPNLTYGGGTNDAFVATINGPALDLAIAKTDGQTSAVPGLAVSYTITVTNNGPDTVTSLFVNDTVPVEITSAAFTPSTGTYSAGTGEWMSLNLAATQSVVLTLAGTIDPFARISLTNTAAVSPPAGVNDTNGVNDSMSDTDTLVPSADVQVVKTDDIDPAPLGGLLTYTLTVRNNGPSGATSVSVQDPLPADMELDTAPGAITPSQGTCSYIVLTRTVSCDLVNLGPTLSATVVIKVRPQALRLFSNTASVTRLEPDPVPANDTENETTLVQVSSLGVRFFTATSTNQRNVLEWINPTDVDYISTEIVVRGDRFPIGPGDGATIYNLGTGGSGGRVKLPHATGALSNGQTFYYGAFVHRSSAPLVSPGRFVSGRPFDHTAGPVKWAFSTGATALAAPTVGGAGVIATSNDKVVYAMERGPLAPAGEWPFSFEPIDVGGPVQGRSPVVPVTVGGANPVIYVGSQDGSIYTIDATAGGSVPYLWVKSIGPMVQAAPAGIFSAFNGATLDYILVGTRDGTGPNAFVALDPYSGVEAERFTNGGAGPGAIGIVNGMAAVDYGPGPPANPRVYFTTYENTSGSTITLWCFELKASPDPVFNPLWGRALGNIDGSPVLRNGRVYVGSPIGGGTVYSIDALDGSNTALDRTFLHGNGQVKGFVFPDRASDDIYFATDDFVWGVTDTGAPLMTNKFAGPISLGGTVKPSPVLFLPGNHYVYVGGTDGKLHEIDVLPAVPVLKQVQLGNGLAVVGAPSLDRVYNLVHVGTEAGIFYAVQVPLP